MRGCNSFSLWKQAFPKYPLGAAPRSPICASSHLYLVCAGRASGPWSRWCRLNKIGDRYLAKSPRGNIGSCRVNNPPWAKFNSPSLLRGAGRAPPVPHGCSPGSQTHQLASPPPQGLCRCAPSVPAGVWSPLPVAGEPGLLPRYRLAWHQLSQQQQLKFPLPVPVPPFGDIKRAHPLLQLRCPSFLCPNPGRNLVSALHRL